MNKFDYFYMPLISGALDATVAIVLYHNWELLTQDKLVVLLICLFIFIVGLKRLSQSYYWLKMHNRNE